MAALMLSSAVTSHILSVPAKVLHTIEDIKLLYQINIVIDYGCSRQLQYIFLTLSDTLHELSLLGAAVLALVALINNDGTEHILSWVKVHAL